MAKTTEIKRRIDAVSSIGAITNAMYLVSMAKLQKHQKRIETLKTYDKLVQEHIVEVVSALEYIDETFYNPLLRLYDKEKEYTNVAYVVFTSDFGLCGGYNTNIVKYLEEELAKNPHVKPFIYMIGKMGIARVKAAGLEVYKTLEVESDILRYSELRDGIVEDVISAYIAEKFDAVRVIYTEYKNPLVQRIRMNEILPLVPIQKVDEGNKKELPAFVEFEPSRSEVLHYLITKNIKTSMYIHYLEAQTSEEAIRRSSMDNANKNGEELIEKLQLIYNRERQSAITQEMAEIIGGSEIL